MRKTTKVSLLLCACSVALCQVLKAGELAVKKGDDQHAEESHGIWHTAGTVNGYGSRRPDKSYPGEKYARVYPGKDTVYSGPMATYSAWHRPMAIHASSESRTSFVFGNPKNRPAISYYDHRRKTFAAPVVVGTNPDMDAHRNPTILIDEAGYIYVFFRAHGHPIKVVKSVLPYDISQWVTLAEIDDKRMSYPQPWQLREREVFVSYRQPPGWHYRKSTDGGILARAGEPDQIPRRFLVRSIFSDMQRMIYYEGGKKECRFVKDVSTPWFNIDGIMSVVSIGKPARVTCDLFGKVDEQGVPIAEQDPFGTHAGQTVRLGVCSLEPRDYQPGQEVFTACLAFVTDTDATGAEQLVSTCREVETGKAVCTYDVRGQDGKPYAVVVNFSDSAAKVTIPGTPATRLITPEAADVPKKVDKDLLLHVVPRGCVLLGPS